MSIKMEVNFSKFCDMFVVCGRNDNFSYEGKRALFDYLEQYSEDTGEDIGLDIIALCCEYQEFGDISEYNEQYDTEYEDMEEVTNDTILIPIDDESFIIQQW